MVTTTIQTYRQIGIREDLSDEINDISPMETPFYSRVRKGKPAKNRYIEWQTDSLPTATGSAQAVEGADAAYITFSPTTRLRNYTQINVKALLASGTANAVNLAGREEELAYQIAKYGRALKRDIEVALTNNRASSAGTSAAARASASFEAWITTNDSRGSGGAQGGYTAAGTVTIATDASSTNQRTFTETRLKSVIRLCWAAGGQPSTVMVGPVNKQKASAFSGITTKYSDFGNNPASPGGLAIVAAADIYLSDFGKLQIVPNRFSRERSALIIDWEYWSMHWLRPMFVKKLADTGDSEKRMMICEWTLKSGNEAASGIIADLLTT